MKYLWLSMKLFRALKIRKVNCYDTHFSRRSWLIDPVKSCRDVTSGFIPRCGFTFWIHCAGDFVEEDDAQAERVPFDLAFMWWSSKKWWTEGTTATPGPLFERIIWPVWLGDNFFSRSNDGQSISYWNSGSIQLQSDGFKIKKQSIPGESGWCEWSLLT